MTDTTGLADALDANRQGRLSAQQLHALESQARWRSKGLVGHALHSRDSFAKDVRAGQVDSIEGAITKKMLTDFTIESAPPSYRIWVANRQAGNQEFHSPADIYESAPDAGMVQLFYLPRSRWVVNLECLPDAPVESLSLDAVKRTLLGELTARAGRDKVGAAEARAELAAMGREMETYLPKGAPPADPQSEQGPLAEAVIGTWESPFLTVSFRPDGALTAQMAGSGEVEGRWSVDSSGRLHADVLGAQRVAEASVAGGELTLGIDDQWLKLRRSAG